MIKKQKENKTHPILVRMPEWLFQECEAMANSQNRSISNYLCQLIMESAKKKENYPRK